MNNWVWVFRFLFFISSYANSWFLEIQHIKYTHIHTSIHRKPCGWISTTSVVRFDGGVFFLSFIQLYFALFCFFSFFLSSLNVIVAISFGLLYALMRLVWHCTRNIKWIYIKKEKPKNIKTKTTEIRFFIGTSHFVGWIHVVLFLCVIFFSFVSFCFCFFFYSVSFHAKFALINYMGVFIVLYTISSQMISY